MNNAGKSHQAADILELCQLLDLRTYIPESKRKTNWTWADKTPDDQREVMGNRQRVRRAKGKQLQKRRSEVCERIFAHVRETGGMRRSWLEGPTDVTKRYLIATAEHNLRRVMWKLLGVGKLRALQGRDAAAAVWEMQSLLLLRHCDQTVPLGGIVHRGVAVACLAG